LNSTNRCNICGQEFDFWDEQEDFSIHKKVGYGSEHDGETVHLRLCCGCFDRLINSCVLNPVEEDC
jgi:hypothetical protein